MRFASVGVATFAGLMLPAYCKLLLVELQDDGGPQLRKEMKGEAY